jgi:hypothetical protein
VGNGISVGIISGVGINSGVGEGVSIGTGVSVGVSVSSFLPGVSSETEVADRLTMVPPKPNPGVGGSLILKSVGANAEPIAES